MSALTFTAPLILSGLLLLPVIWWLLRATPPAPQKTPFGGTIFLDGLQSRKETPDRTPWWLLFIRLAAIAAAIVGLAGPLLNAQQEFDGDGPVLVVVDDSWPAASGWRGRQNAFRAVAIGPGAAARPTRILTTAGEPTLSEPVSLTAAVGVVDGLVPKAALPNRLDALEALGDDFDWEGTDVLWLSDGVMGRLGADRDFLRHVSNARSLTVFRTPGQPTLAVTGLAAEGPDLTATVRRIGARPDGGTLLAYGGDGRILTNAPFTFDPGAQTTTVPIDLPLSLRNEIRRLSIEGQRSAGATWLLDNNARRIRAGIVTERADSLLDSGFYLEQALSTRAVVSRGPVADLITPEVRLIVLDDVGTLRAADEAALDGWVRAGGVLVRFSGPNTASAAGEPGTLRPPTFPVALRGSERSFGGALTWADPQRIDAFPPDSPFSDLSVDDSVEVRRQVLTRPSGDPGHVVWAALQDGTPLVTARPNEEGLLVLFHVTATPTWSDLPVSGLFPEMIDRITRLAAGAFGTDDPNVPLAPLRLLDGYGALGPPPGNAQPAAPEALGAGTAAPGLYGAPDNAYAVNTYPEGSAALDPLTGAQLPPNAVLRGEESANARRPGPILLALALGLFALDGLILAIRHWRAASGRLAAAIMIATVSGMTISGEGYAQSLAARPDLDRNALVASLRVTFGYVQTGDRELDRLVEAGLYGLSREATRRSALEPADPVPVDIERDELSVYPMIYWAITPGMPAPSDDALARLESFMAGGGMLIIDTRDGERLSASIETPASGYLREILLRMNVPPLEPMPPGHILGRSFYRLNDLEGRNTGGPVWVEAEGALRESTDGVPSLIIGGRDWAAAWAKDRTGRFLRPAGARGEAGREMAIRAGINFAMVALTGNYKGDQVHVQELLDRLGQDQ